MEAQPCGAFFHDFRSTDPLAHHAAPMDQVSQKARVQEPELRSETSLSALIRSQ